LPSGASAVIFQVPATSAAWQIVANADSTVAIKTLLITV
jgi:hypothetical protein